MRVIKITMFSKPLRVVREFREYEPFYLKSFSAEETLKYIHAICEFIQSSKMLRDCFISFSWVFIDIFRLAVKSVDIVDVIRQEGMIRQFAGFYFVSPASTTLLKLCRPTIRQLSSKIPFVMKVDTPEFHCLFTPALKTLLGIFSDRGYEIRIAGGAVRDILSGNVPKDVDFATSATPDMMKEMFAEKEIRLINSKGEKHGTITARIESENFEVTTLRIDVTTDGRHATVEFTTDWELDANRRDLTVNSMFLGADGTLYDYFNGYEDLKAKRVAFVGDSNKRIKEDYLRILRYFRFYGRISAVPDKHEPEILKAIKDNIDGLGRISGERIWMEFSKIVTGNYAASLISRLVEVGASKYIGLPAEPMIDEFRVVSKRCEGLNLNPISLLVSLLKSEQEMLDLASRLKLSTFEKNLGRYIIAHRHQDKFELEAFQRDMMNKKMKQTDTRRFIVELLRYTVNLAMLDDFQRWEPPVCPINGLILKQNNVPDGVQMGRVLNILQDSWVSSKFQKTLDDLLNELPDVMATLKIVPTK